MVQNFCCCWCLVLLVTVGRSALRFGNTLWTFSAEIQQASDGRLLNCGTTILWSSSMYYYIAQYILCTTTQQFEAVRSFKAGVGIHHYTMTTIRLQLGRQYIRVRLYCQSYTRRTTTAHSSSSRRWRRADVGGSGAAGATLSAGVACMDQAVNHCHSDGSSCSPVFTTATSTRLPPPPQQPPVCPVEVKHDTHWKM